MTYTLTPYIAGSSSRVVTLLAATTRWRAMTDAASLPGRPDASATRSVFMVQCCPVFCLN